MVSNPEQGVDAAACERLELTGCQDVRVAMELQRSIIELLAFNEPVVIDCTKVDSLDASAMQLLMSAKRESSDNLEIVAPADGEVHNWFRLAGINDQLLRTSTDS